MAFYAHSLFLKLLLRSCIFKKSVVKEFGEGNPQVCHCTLGQVFFPWTFHYCKESYKTSIKSVFLSQNLNFQEYKSETPYRLLLIVPNWDQAECLSDGVGFTNHAVSRWPSHVAEMWLVRKWCLHSERVGWMNKADFMTVLSYEKWKKRGKKGQEI